MLVQEQEQEYIRREWQNLDSKNKCLEPPFIEPKSNANLALFQSIGTLPVTWSILTWLQIKYASIVFQRTNVTWTPSRHLEHEQIHILIVSFGSLDHAYVNRLKVTRAIEVTCTLLQSPKSSQLSQSKLSPNRSPRSHPIA